MAAGSQKATNKWVARIIPAILAGLIFYSAYVITKVVAIDYLINPHASLHVRPRPGIAAVILLFYYLLVIPVLVSYARLLQTIITNPGYVPRSAAWHEKRKEERAQKGRHKRGFHSKRRPSSHLAEKPTQPLQSSIACSQDVESDGSHYSSLSASKEHHANSSHPSDNASSIEVNFWHRDIFVCNPDGRPTFCSSCLTNKPDRTHHCREVDRCVLKMDHFCPWVGGIVSETSFKFFIQFLVYAALFCVMVLTTISVFIAERREREGSRFLDVHYFVILGVAGLFLLFTLGMAGSSIQLSLVNSTTIENLKRRSKVWFLAVLIPRTADGQLPPLAAPAAAGGAGQSGFQSPSFQTITYPRPAEEEQFLLAQARGGENGLLSNPYSPPPPPPPPRSAPHQPATRTFAILSTKPGENPFDIGAWANIREVMGYSILEWILPIKMSPCADHRSRVSSFRMNEELVKRLKEEVGLVGSDARERKEKAERRGEGRRSYGGNGGNGGGGGGGSETEDYETRKKKRKRRSRRISAGEKGGH